MTKRGAERTAKRYVLSVDQDAYAAKAHCRTKSRTKAVCSAATFDADVTCIWLLGVFQRPAGTYVYVFSEDCS